MDREIGAFGIFAFLFSFWRQNYVFSLLQAFQTFVLWLDWLVCEKVAVISHSAKLNNFSINKLFTHNFVKFFFIFTNLKKNLVSQK